MCDICFFYFTCLNYYFGQESSDNIAPGQKKRLIFKNLNASINQMTNAFLMFDFVILINTQKK